MAVAPAVASALGDAPACMPPRPAPASATCPAPAPAPAQAPPARPARAPLAVFDFDGTCIDGQSGFLIGRYLLRHGMLSPRATTALAWWGTRYKLRLPVRQERARELVLAALNRHRPSEVAEIMSAFHDDVLVRRYRPDAVAEIARRRAQGCVVLLVSATFAEVAERAADHLGADAVIATRMERGADGRYTGRVEGPVVAGRAKVTSVVSWADACFGPGGWYVRAAYGDHHSDAGLLGVAAEPFAVCPSHSLAAHARRSGWPTLEWPSGA